MGSLQKGKNWMKIWLPVRLRFIPSTRIWPNALSPVPFQPNLVTFPGTFDFCLFCCMVMERSTSHLSHASPASPRSLPNWGFLGLQTPFSHSNKVVMCLQEDMLMSADQVFMCPKTFLCCPGLDFLIHFYRVRRAWSYRSPSLHWRTFPAHTHCLSLLSSKNVSWTSTAWEQTDK